MIRKIMVLCLLFAFVGNVGAEAWGENDSGQCDTPSDLSNVIAISSGSQHTVVLQNDGTVRAWGSDSYGQCAIPSDLSNVIAISAGWGHTVVLQSDGTVRAWGYNTSGQCNVPSDLSNVIAISARSSHNVALQSDGTVRVWGGYNSSGECNVPVDLSTVTAISAGGNHTVVLQSDGTVRGWGNNAYGQCTLPLGLSNVMTISSGAYHTVALKSDGTVSVWGKNNNGQCNIPSDLSNVIAISAGWGHTVALKSDGTIRTWGYNNKGQCNAPSDLSNVIAISSGDYHTVAFSTNKMIYAYTNEEKNFYPSVYLRTNEPCEITTDDIDITNATIVSLEKVNSKFYKIKTAPTGISEVTVGIQAGVVQGDITNAFNELFSFSYTPTLSAASRQLYVGVNSARGCVLGFEGEGHPVASPSITTPPTHGTLGSIVNGQVLYTPNEDWKGDDSFQFSINNGRTTATATIKISTQHIVAWGNNEYGQCDVPLDLSSVISIAGYGHTVVLQNDGTVRAWGENNYGQCDVPSDLSNVITIAAGYAHTVALQSDGTVRAWGYNGNGQCDIPADLSNVTAISAGRGHHTVALQSDGTVRAWGSNNYGQCGIPSDLSTVTAISAGSSHTIVLQSDGTVRAWGRNTYGECNVPSDLSSVIAISAGWDHTVVLQSDGTVRVWGRNHNGQCDIPFNPSNITAIAAGGSHTVVLQNDGTVRAWGRNTEGQCGIPSGLSNVVAISGAATHTVVSLSTDSSVMPYILPTNIPFSTSTLPINIDFNTDVTGFTIDDIVIDNDSEAIIQNFQQIDARHYTANLISKKLGAITITIPAASCKDFALRDNSEAQVTLTANLSVEDRSLNINEDNSVEITLACNNTEDTLTYNATSPSNGSISLIGDKVTYTPNTDWFGSDSFTYTVNNGAYTSNPATISITCNPINDLPTIDTPSTITVLEDSVTPISLTGITSGNPFETAIPQVLTMSVLSSDVNKFSIDKSYTSHNSTGIVTITAVPNVYGDNETATITLQDNGGTGSGGVDTKAVSFTVNITPVNDPPLMDAPSNMNINEDASEQTVNLTGIKSGPDNESAQTMELRAVSSNPAIIPNPTIVYADNQGATATLTYTPVENAHSASGVDIFVVIKDNGLNANGGLDSASKVFNVIVNPQNDDPILANNNTISVAKSTTEIITNTNLLVTDVDLVDTLTYTLVTVPTGGDLKLDATTLIATNTFTQADIDTNKLSYTNTVGTAGVDDTFSFTLSDGSSGSISETTFTLSIVETTGNQKPVVNISAADLLLTEDAAASFMDSSATVTDIDSANFDGGTLSVAITGDDETDNISILSVGEGAGQISIDGSLVKYEGTQIGVITSGLDNTYPLTVSLNSSATPANVTALLKQVKLAIIGDNPSSNDRTLSVTVSDGLMTSNISSKTIKVTALNDIPIVALFSAGQNYIEGIGTILINEIATVSDVDSPDLDTGVLSIAITANGTANDILGIRSQGTGAGEVGISTNKVLYSNVEIGTWATSPSNPLLLTCNAASTPAAIQAVLRNITFTNNSENPTATERTVTVTLTDGDTGTSTPVTTTITIIPQNDAPSLVINSSALVSYTENDGDKVVAPAVTVTDVDNDNFNGGELIVSISTGKTANDSLSVTAVGNITVVGSSIKYSGTEIATQSTADPLKLLLNASCTKAYLEALIESIAYKNSSDNPSNAIRLLSFDLSDGTNSASTQMLTLTVSPQNDKPVLTIAGGTPTYIENASPTILDASLALEDLDSSDFDNGVLTLSITTNGTTNDVLSITPSADITKTADTISYQTNQIATYSGGTESSPLVILLSSSNATKLATEKLLQQLSFSNTSEAPTSLTRTITISISDGDGAVSDSKTKDITVIPKNDDPVLDTNVSLVTQTGITNAITNTNLLVTDIDNDPAIDLVYTITQLPVYGTLSKTVSWTQDDINNNLVTYTSTGTDSVNDSIKFTVSDSHGGSIAESTFTISVSPALVPVITVIDTSVVCEETAVSKFMTGSSVTDEDSADFDTGAITAILSNEADGDYLFVSSVNTIVVNGSVVTFGGVEVATIERVSDISITLLLNSSASVDAVTALLQALSYKTNSDNPSTAEKTITININDGDGGVSNDAIIALTVSPVNDAPVSTSIDAVTTKNTEVVISLIATDIDDDDSQLTYEIITPPTGTIVQDGKTITYTPVTDSLDSDSFTYVSNDGELNSALATVTIKTTSPLSSSVLAFSSDPAISVLSGNVFTYDFTIDIRDLSETPALEYQLSGDVPTGMTLTDAVNGGTIEWTADNTKESYKFEILVIDTVNEVACKQSVLLMVHQAGDGVN